MKYHGHVARSTASSTVAATLFILFLASASAAAAGGQPPAGGPRGTAVRAYILELPQGLPENHALVALYRGCAIPALAIPYPLKPVTLNVATAVATENHGMLTPTIITTAVKRLVWSPGGRELLVIVPARPVCGYMLTQRQLEELRELTLAAYRAGSLEFRIIAPTRDLMYITVPPFAPPISSDTIFGYDITMGRAKLDVDIAPDTIEKLAATAPVLEPLHGTTGASTANITTTCSTRSPATSHSARATTHREEANNTTHARTQRATLTSQAPTTSTHPPPASWSSPAVLAALSTATGAAAILLLRGRCR